MVLLGGLTLGRTMQFCDADNEIPLYQMFHHIIYIGQQPIIHLMS